MISNLELLKQELIKDLLEKQESGFLKNKCGIINKTH